MRSLRTAPVTVAFGLILLAVAGGLWKFDAVADDQAADQAAQAQRAVRQDWLLCQAINENRGVLRDLVTRQAPIPVPDGADAALRQVLEDSNARSVMFREDALRRIGSLRPCGPEPAPLDRDERARVAGSTTTGVPAP